MFLYCFILKIRWIEKTVNSIEIELTTMDRENSQFYYNSTNYGKCESALRLIRLSTVSNLFQFEVVQKYQCCQLCVLQGNSRT